MNKIKRILISSLLFISFSFLYSQELEEGQTLDKIMAVVGEEIIMMSDLQGRLMMLKQQNPSIDIDDESLREEVFNSLIDEKLIITKAKEDSIQVSEEEIVQRWEMLKDRYVSYFGSEKRVEDVFGMSMTRLKLQARESIKNQLLADYLQRRKFSNLEVTPAEVAEYYKNNKDSLPKIPRQYVVNHIVKFVEAEIDKKKQVYDLAKKVRDSIAKGGNFAEFAMRYSDDPGTRADGGELGWFDKGKLLPEFEKAAFELQPGQLSQPIETPFGFHVIQTVDKKEKSINTKHILFKIGESTEDQERVKNELLDIKKRVEKGEDFEELAMLESDEKETKGFGGQLGKFVDTEVPPAVMNVLEGKDVGFISDPIPYNSSDPSKKSYHIVYMKEIIEPHIPTLDNDYDLIENKAMQDKQITKYEGWIDELRSELYWEIKD